MIRVIFIHAVLICLAAFQPEKGLADIYMFVDDDGVLHFTNVPTSSDYTLYMKEKTDRAPVVVRGNNRRFDPIIKKAAKTFGLDFSLIKAVVSVESNFNPKAVSRKGAKGLMQIMPGNFRHLNIKDPFDPAQNIMGGSRYLKKMMTRYQGRTNLALAAYNAGPDAVDRYRRVPPFKETRNYVSKVMQRYRFFKQN